MTSVKRLNSVSGVKRLIRRPLAASAARGLRHFENTDACIALPSRLTLCSFNMQAAIGTDCYRGYVTGSWKHLLASADSLPNLQAIAAALKGYDIVALQEVDGGSLRSRYINQLHFIADEAGFDYRYQQRNRNLGKLGQFCNGLLGRYAPFHVENHGLPGMLPGRGAIVSLFGDRRNPLVVVNVHLALSRKVRQQQLLYLAHRLSGFEQLVVMGDFNCALGELEQSPLMNLVTATQLECSYPSWAPSRRLDHILVSPGVRVTAADVLNSCRLSDHLPVRLEILFDS